MSSQCGSVASRLSPLASGITPCVPGVDLGPRGWAQAGADIRRPGWAGAKGSRGGEGPRCPHWPGAQASVWTPPAPGRLGGCEGQYKVQAILPSRISSLAGDTEQWAGPGTAASSGTGGLGARGPGGQQGGHPQRLLAQVRGRLRAIIHKRGQEQLDSAWGVCSRQYARRSGKAQVS